jgi:hypothetical protein
MKQEKNTKRKRKKKLDETDVDTRLVRKDRRETKREQKNQKTKILSHTREELMVEKKRDGKILEKRSE